MSLPKSFPIAALLFLTLPTPLFAQAPATPIPPVVNDPALRVELIATVPEVEACTTVCSDPQGAIYVGNDPRDGRLNTKDPVCTIVRFGAFESPDQIKLPNGSLAPAGAPRRQRTVFADKLYSPAGSAWHDGWLYVIHDPFMTRFKDTDGDGVADLREDLISNLGIPPNPGLNDHVVSGFTLGMDGFWYISVGDRGIYQAASAKDGSTITMQGGGIARCRTDGTQLEVFSTGTRNHLGVNLDAEDNAFTRDNTDDGNGWWTRLTHHIEGGYYGYPHDYRSAPNYGVTQPSEQTISAIRQHGGPIDTQATMIDGRKVFTTVSGTRANPKPAEDAVPDQQSTGNDQHSVRFLPAIADFGGGSPTGGFCYLSDGLPEKYRGKHFFSEWGKAGLFVTEVARDGATFKLVSDTKLVEAGKGGEFRPMQSSVAADGSILIADWGYGGWKSPKVAGAVWRVYWPEAKPAPRLADESKATIDELLEALGHPDRDQRLRAQSSLTKAAVAEAPKEKAEWLWNTPPTIERIDALAKDKGRSVTHRLHALWALSETARAEQQLLELLLEIYGTRSGNGAKEVGFLLRGLITDEDPTIRWQSVKAASKVARLTVPLPAPANDTDPRVRLQLSLAHAKRGHFSPEFILMLADPDAWVQLAARGALRRHLRTQTSQTSGRGLVTIVELLSKALTAADPVIRENAWHVVDTREPYYKVGGRLLAERGFDGTLQTVLPLAAAGEKSEVRTRAISALASIAYQPKPYDGHWWGTQPVKTPPPPNSVAWEGTPQALGALTTALADADTDVRLAAAKAFTRFAMPDDRAAPAPSQVVPGAPAGNSSPAAAAVDLRETPAGAPKTTREGACATLRARLTAEPDAAVREQLVAALGVQKDAGAMDAFRQIALDEKADAGFRETAIGAIVNIGGDAARKTIVQLSDAKLSPAATRKIIIAAGEMKVLEAAPSLTARLKDENAENREAAAKSLQQLGPKSNAGPALIEALADKEGRVLGAAVEALGSYRDKAALPALINLVEKRRAKREALEAISKMPDESAIPVLVDSLRDKDTGIRRNAIKALKTMREKARPQIDALLISGRVPEELVPEIRNAFESGAITRWKMVGVFENVWDAVHPPEADMLGSQASVTEMRLLERKYHNAEGKDVGWIDVTADSEVGRIDLEKLFKSNAMVCAYAYTEIEAAEAVDAKLFTSADDELAVWLNGQRVLNEPGNHGFETDKNETPLQLRAGKNQLFVKIGNKGGNWAFHARMPGFEDGKFIKSKEPTAEEKQRLFALATKPDGTWINAGDVQRGEKLFHDPAAPMAAICATCHVVRGKGGQIGPDLSAVGTNYKRADLIASIHEPSKTIALGFEQVMVETTGGDTWLGALRSEAGDALTVMGADGQSHVIPRANVKTRTDIKASLMPPGLTIGLKPQEFADLLAYLESLRGQ